MALDLDKLNFEDAEKFVTLALEGLDAISGLLSNSTASRAEEILTGVRAVVATISKGYDGAVSFAQAREELERFRESLASNDDAADAALRTKFNEPE